MESQPQAVPTSNKIYLQRALAAVEEFRKLHPDLPMTVASLFTYVAANPGVSMDELRKQTNTKQATCSRTIAVLSEWQEYDKPGFGLVWTEADPKERRKKLVHLTEMGEELAVTLDNILH